MKLVKEIKSKEGVLHFQRYLIFSTPWFHCYLHKIYQADQDKHLHSHPWRFWGLILWGGYVEETEQGIKTRGWLSSGGGDLNYFHKIHTMLQSPTITLFFTGRQTYPWYYLTSEGKIDHESYRQRKYDNSLPL
jgi:hypothetical protein